jgi:excisionase family DNA binding protein
VRADRDRAATISAALEIIRAARRLVAQLPEADQRELRLLCADLGIVREEPAPRRPVPVAYTTSTLAAELGVTSKTVRGWIASGDLRAVRRGGRYLISVAAVDEFASPPARPTRDSLNRPRRRPQTGLGRGTGPLRRALADLTEPR